MTTLSVGCGKQEKQPDLIRLDISERVEPDLVWNLEQYPYPFEDSKFSTIECFDVIEHLQDIPKVMEEFHRILEPGGIVKVTTPHFSCANSYIDPTHKYHLSYFSLDYFCKGHKLSYYSSAQFRIKARHLQFQGGRFNRSIISRIANQFPKTYEQRYAWLFPAWFLYFEIEAIKDN